MVTDYIRDAFSLPENFSYYTQKIIFIQILTRGKNPLNPLHLALPISTLFLSSEIYRIKNKVKSGAKQPL